MLISRLVLLSSWIFFVSAASQTIIDVLSSSAQYSILLSHIRRLQLVTELNTAHNVTFVAPVNSAFSSTTNEDVTKEVLYYHILNQVVLETELKGDEVIDSWLVENTEPVPVLASGLNDGLYFNSIKVVESDQKAGWGRGVVQAVDKIMPIPNEACQVMKDQLASDKFARLISLEGKCSASQRQTLLVPTNQAFDSIYNQVELDYLFHKQGRQDRRRIINRHLIPERIIPGDIEFTEVTALDGELFEISNGGVINTTFEPRHKNILTKHGIIHTYDSFLANRDLVNFTPEKYLYGLSADHFVKELVFRDLEYLINGSSSDDPQTMFVPFGASNNGMVHTKGSSSLKYHFVQGQYHLTEHVNESFLMSSLMTTKKLGGHHQRVKTIVTASGQCYLNGIEVVSREYQVGNTSIYFIDGDLGPPPSLSQAVGPFFQNSYSVSFLERLKLLHPPKGASWTVFMPTRDAWQKQGLVMNHLSQNETALRRMFESMIITKPFYSDSEPQQLEFLDGKVANVSSMAFNDSTVETKAITIGDKKQHLNAADILFEAGVAHSVNDLSIPPSIDITASDLVRAGDREHFINLLHARNLSHVLEPEANYTILVPSIQSLQNHNVTENSADIDLLLAMHILPGNPIKQLMHQEKVNTMAEDVVLRARDISHGLYFIQIVGGADHELHILNRGDTTNFNGSSSTVLFIDRHLRTEWIASPFPGFPPPFGKKPLKTPIAILLGVVGGAILIFSIISMALYVYLRSKEKKSGERQPLLDEEEGGAAGASGGNGEQRTSPPSRRHSRQSSRGLSVVNEQPPAQSTTSAPIRTTSVQPDREFGRHLNLPGQEYR